MVRLETESSKLADKREHDRRKACLVLCRSFLEDMRLFSAAKSLVEEAKELLQDVEVADNMSLMVIAQEFETFYEIKHGKRPQLMRKSGSPGLAVDNRQNLKAKADRVLTLHKSINQDENANPKDATITELSVVGTKPHRFSHDNHDSDFNRVSIPIAIANNPEFHELAQSLLSENQSTTQKVHWADIEGLEEAKQALREAVILPQQHPDLFQGILAPWRGILLYGSPGCGKTLLARATAFESKCAFFSVNPSSLLSKWRGESEKLVRCLFNLAEHNKPSVIFIDEIDALFSSQASSETHEHESTKRMRAELLMAMDGFNAEHRGVFVLAATNNPWSLSDALLRRFEKRILIDLPDDLTKLKIISKLLPKMPSQSVDIVNSTRDWSCDDIRLLCKETAMVALRRCLNNTKQIVKEVQPNEADLRLALARVKPTNANYKAFKDWHNKFGSY